jgi:hypothetical protein
LAQTDRLGGVVWVDTVFIKLAPSEAIIHLIACGPIATWAVARAANCATAKAKSVPPQVIADRPFKVDAIEADGGSKFKSEFKQGCADRGLPLYQLPPKRSELNGAVERCNGAAISIYGLYDLPTALWTA